MTTAQKTIIHDGKTKIPEEIMSALNLQEGQQMAWHISPTGSVIIEFDNIDNQYTNNQHKQIINKRLAKFRQDGKLGTDYKVALDSLRNNLKRTDIF